VQFHAEKSSTAGLRLLANFAQICIDALEPSAAACRSEPARGQTRKDEQNRGE
jgi:hypothetical protein